MGIARLFGEQADFCGGEIGLFVMFIRDVKFATIDGTGAGEAVWSLVRKFFPAAQCLQYSPALKRALV
ncbi:hypothetical protein [Sodalis glossinidius]|nr:hypothetical protein [Sodalis glossinidius]